MPQAVKFHDVKPWEKGFYLVLVASDNPNAAVCVTLENGMTEDFLIWRIKNAFAALEAGMAANRTGAGNASD